MKKYDAFVSYASEDKTDFALPLAEKLRSIGLNIWFDDFCMKIGDSLREKIDLGLSSSNYGIVVLSHNFFDKQWPQKELNALYSLEVEGRSAILPVWKDIGRKHVALYSPLLADKWAAKSYEGIDKVAAQLVEVIDPENQYLDQFVQQELAKQKSEEYPGFDIRVIGQANYKIIRGPGFYDPSKKYICISVSNRGTRDVIIEKVGLHFKRSKKQFALAHDSLIFGPRRLKDGDRADYFIEQDSISDLSLVDYVWASDKVSRTWKGGMKL